MRGLHDGGGGFFGSLRVVLDFARHSRLVSSLLLSKTMFGVGTGVVLMLAVFAHDVFRAGDVGIGLLFAARGLGALIGPFLARALVGTTNRGLLLGIGGSIGTVALAYALFPLAPTIWIAALLVFVAHLGGGAQWMLSTFGSPARDARPHPRSRLQLRLRAGDADDRHLGPACRRPV